MTSLSNTALPPYRAERTVRELQDERDRLLSAGHLRLAAEVTTWIDELFAEGGRIAPPTVPGRRAGA